MELQERDASRVFVLEATRGDIKGGGGTHSHGDESAIILLGQSHWAAMGIPHHIHDHFPHFLPQILTRLQSRVIPMPGGQ